MVKIALVTGAGGFIGANLVRRLLNDGYEVHGIVKPKEDLWRLTDLNSQQWHQHEVDITNREEVFKLLEAVKPAYVFHLTHYGGNRGQTDHNQVRQVVIEGTVNLYEACLEAGSCQAIVNAGSSSEYGAKTELMCEDMVLEPNTPYGLAKAWATLYGQHLAREQSVPIVTLRFFSVYGPYEASIRLMPAVILSCLKQVAPQLSNPQTARDFVHVDDVVEAMLLVAGKINEVKGQIFNIGSGKQNTIKDAVEIILRLTKANVELNWGGIESRSFDSNCWVADTHKAMQQLGWQPKFDLEQGLTKTVQWFYEHQSLYQNN